SSSSSEIISTSSMLLLTETTNSFFLLLYPLFNLVPTIFIVNIITKESVAKPITLTIIPNAESFGKLSCNLSQNDFSLGELTPC
ncbi:MAG: hypothetical protein CMB48_07615, partial [Euryarchaeota archaeon]|nr:hypothetical protein [Euryarchaeota archaeon]